MGHAGVARAHIDNFCLAGAEFFHDDADVIVRHLNHEQFDRLAAFPVNLFINDLRAGNLELISLTAHLLNQDREMQLTASTHLKRLGGVSFLHAHGDVGLNLFEQAVAQVTGGDILALAPCKGAVVDHKDHGNGRLVDLDKRQRFDAVGRANGLPDVQICDAGNCHDVAKLCAFHLDAFEAFKLIQLNNPDVLRGTVAVAKHDIFAVVHLAALHTADADTSHIIVIVHIGEEHLCWAVQLTRRRRHFFEDHIKQRLHVLTGHCGVQRRIAVPAGCIHHREFELVVVGPQLDKEV